MKLLIIEDNEHLSDAMATILRAQGFAVDLAVNAAEGQRTWRGVTYDAVILDLMLPDQKGLDLLEQMRKEGHANAVLIITALDAVEDRVRGLDRGADDYLVKPFAMQELVARIRALLRRPGSALGRTLELGNVSLDTSARTAYVDDAPLELTRSELVALEILLRNQGKVVPKERLGELVHDLNQEWSANSVESLVHRLRRKLTTAGAGMSIGTLRGLGYLAS
jgi:DNA-binding response OmpR family regulator